MSSARGWLKHLRWIGLGLILAAILVQFVLHDRPEAVAVVEGIERGFVFLVFGVISLMVLGLMLHFLGSLLRPNEDADWGEPVLRLRNSRMVSALLVLALLAFGAIMAFAWLKWSEPGGPFDPPPQPVSLEAQLVIGFFTVVWGFLLVAFTVRLIRNPAWFVLTRKGFVYRPGDVAPGLVRWEDVVEIKEDEVLSSGPPGGPTLRPALVIVLRDAERYTTVYNPLLAMIVRLATGALRAQTGGRGDLYLDPVHFGARYEEVKALMREHARYAR